MRPCCHESAILISLSSNFQELLTVLSIFQVAGGRIIKRFFDSFGVNKSGCEKKLKCYQYVKNMCDHEDPKIISTAVDVFHKMYVRLNCHFSSSRFFWAMSVHGRKRDNLLTFFSSNRDIWSLPTLIRIWNVCQKSFSCYRVKKVPPRKKVVSLQKKIVSWILVVLGWFCWFYWFATIFREDGDKEDPKPHMI